MWFLSFGDNVASGSCCRLKTIRNAKRELLSRVQGDTRGNSVSHLGHPEIDIQWQFTAGSHARKVG